MTQRLIRRITVIHFLLFSTRTCYVSSSSSSDVHFQPQDSQHRRTASLPRLSHLPSLFLTSVSYFHQIMSVLFPISSCQVIRRPPGFILAPTRAPSAAGWWSSEEDYCVKLEKFVIDFVVFFSRKPETLARQGCCAPYWD